MSEFDATIRTERGPVALISFTPLGVDDTAAKEAETAIIAKLESDGFEVTLR